MRGSLLILLSLGGPLAAAVGLQSEPPDGRDGRPLCLERFRPRSQLRVDEQLETYPNLHVELAARIAELGRQPYTAERFFRRYADRILFGTDGPRTSERLAPHWRFLETRDEYFRYADTPFPPQGLWNIYGLGLPDEILRKVYHQNAARLIPGVARRIEAYAARRPGPAAAARSGHVRGVE